MNGAIVRESEQRGLAAPERKGSLSRDHSLDLDLGAREKGAQARRGGLSKPRISQSDLPRLGADGGEERRGRRLAAEHGEK